MLLKNIGIIISILSCLGLYLTHNNQKILQKPLSRTTQFSALVGMIFSLIILVYSLPLLVAILIWLSVATLVWSFTPFIPLIMRLNK